MAEIMHGCVTVGADPRSKSRLLVLPEIQELASAAPRNYWKLSWGGRVLERNPSTHTQKRDEEHQQHLTRRKSEEACA